MLTAPPRLAMRLVAPRLWRCFDAIGAVGAAAAGAAAGAAALGGDLAAGVIGACAHAGAAIARAAAIATPFKRCFMLCPLWQFWIGEYAATACFTRGRPSRASGRKQPSCCSVPANTQLLASRIRPRR